MSVNVNEIISIAQNEMLEFGEQGFGEANALNNALSKKPNLKYIPGCLKFQQPLRLYPHTQRGFFNGSTDTIGNQIERQLDHAIFDIKYWYTSLSYSLEDFATTHQSREAIISLIEAKAKGAKIDNENFFNQAVFGSGTGTNINNFNGLEDIFADENTSYGGILPTDLPDKSLWLTQRTTDSLTPTFNNLNGPISKLQALGSKNGDENGRFKPNMIISQSDVRVKYENSLQAQQRFVDTDALEAGFDGIKFKDLSWFTDEYSPARHIYVLATNTLSMRYIYGFEGKRSPLDNETQQSNQAIKSNQAYMVANITCSHRRPNGVFTNIDMS